MLSYNLMIIILIYLAAAANFAREYEYLLYFLLVISLSFYIII